MVNSWIDLKRDLRHRFVPSYDKPEDPLVLSSRLVRISSSYYARGMYIKLQRLYQGCRIVEDYYKEIEMGLMKP
ncbi:hypothetical protein CR513_13415, partial [Mucuna pruriens]